MLCVLPVLYMRNSEQWLVHSCTNLLGRKVGVFRYIFDVPPEAVIEVKQSHEWRIPWI